VIIDKRVPSRGEWHRRVLILWQEDDADPTSERVSAAADVLRVLQRYFAATNPPCTGSDA
jgi:hypothetical protein